MPITIPIGTFQPKAQMRRCVTFKCHRCKSENVVRDAYVEWDKPTQKWVVKAVFDHAECLDCSSVTKLAEEVIS